MRRSAGETFSVDGVLRYLVLRTGRIVLWWLTAEYMIHAMYMHAIQANESYLESLPPWALGMPPPPCRIIMEGLKYRSQLGHFRPLSGYKGCE
jgi:hypothetical protein